jgi:hypothetical protein
MASDWARAVASIRLYTDSYSSSSSASRGHCQADDQMRLPHDGEPRKATFSRLSTKSLPESEMAPQDTPGAEMPCVTTTSRMPSTKSVFKISEAGFVGA